MCDLLDMLKPSEGVNGAQQHCVKDVMLACQFVRIKDVKSMKAVLNVSSVVLSLKKS